MVNVVDVGFEEFEEMIEVCEWYRVVRDGREDVIERYVEMVEMKYEVMFDICVWLMEKFDEWYEVREEYEDKNFKWIDEYEVVCVLS